MQYRVRKCERWFFTMIEVYKFMLLLLWRDGIEKSWDWAVLAFR